MAKNVVTKVKYIIYILASRQKGSVFTNSQSYITTHEAIFINNTEHTRQCTLHKEYTRRYSYICIYTYILGFIFIFSHRWTQFRNTCCMHYDLVWWLHIFWRPKAKFWIHRITFFSYIQTHCDAISISVTLYTIIRDCQITL